MKYRTVVIDPPWQITPISESISKKFHSPLAKGLPYNTMTDKELEQFPINDFCDDNCDLFLWTTHSKLLFALELIKIWGFKYHCLMTWDKKEGINCWGFTRNSEFIIYCYRGKMGIRLDSKKNIPTVFHEKRTTHSTKPQTFYNLIMKSSLEPRIDIFARKKHIGFDSFGNQAEEPLTLEAFTS